MGKTHFRSDVRESGARTASFSTIAAGTITAGGAISATGIVTGTGGLVAGSGKYVKIGSVYIITGNLGTFDSATINAAATLALGATTATMVPIGTLFLNSSSNSASYPMFHKHAHSAWQKIYRTAAV